MKRSNNINLYQLKRETKGLRGDAGRALCCFCREEIPNGRRSWCSADCVHQYRLLNDWRYVVDQVFKRDRGVCVDCGLDTAALKKHYRRLSNWVKVRNAKNQYKIAFRYVEKLFSQRYNLRSRLYGVEFCDVHHVIPLSEGGGIGIDNLVTLCVSCHKRRHARKAQPLGT